MILPLLAAYLLFAWINSYNNDQKVEEHVYLLNEMEEIKKTLDNPELYTVQTNREELESFANQNQFITLYNQDGVVIYTSNPSFTSAHLGLGKEQMYKDLYVLEEGYRSYSYKQPVFDQNELVGFFHIQLARTEWVEGVTNRSYLVAGVFIIVFTLIYLTVIRLVNQKLNVRLTGLMEDMTAFASGKTIEERRTNDDEIGKLMKHFYDMKRQINTARKTIEQEQEAKEYLIASVSHDLKTPLTSIKAYAESLDHQQLTVADQTEYQQVIVEKADFMQQMLDDLLTYTLLQSPTHDMELVEVEGSEFFDMLVSDYEPLCKKKGVRLITNVDVCGIYHVNPKQMMRVADNLVSNAIQHTRSGGQMWVAGLSSEKALPNWLFDFVIKEDFLNHDAVYFIVQNEGIGISENKLAYVFDPLYQADEARSKRHEHRAGLGLSITKQIIEKHHGKVYIYSKENIGTCVICTLPKKS